MLVVLALVLSACGGAASAETVGEEPAAEEAAAEEAATEEPAEEAAEADTDGVIKLGALAPRYGRRWRGHGGCHYARKDLDISQASLGGAFIGAALGPIGLIPLWIATPTLSSRWITLSGVLIVGILAWAFTSTYPENLCVTNRGSATCTAKYR